MFQNVFHPSADAYVEDGASANKNFGTSAQLLSKKSDSAGFNRNSLIKFDLATLASSANDVILRVYGKLQDTRGTNVPTDVFTTTTGWTKTGVKWNNKPAASGARLGTIVVTNKTGAYYEMDATAFVRAELAAGRKTVSFLLRNPVAADPFSAFGSRDSSNKPQLVMIPGN